MSTQAARLLALAFDPSVHTADDAISERILDAARDRGVYRRMQSREALIDALAVRECRRCLARIQDALDPDAPLIDRLASLFTVTLKVIREHPLLARLARVEPEALVSELTRDGSAVFGMVQEFLVTPIEEGQCSEELIDADPALLAELGLRLGASFVLIPDSVLALEDDEATRTAVRRLLVPLLVK